MATATIVAAWETPTAAYAAVRVAEGGSLGNVEYIASTPLVDGSGNSLGLTLPQVKANLVAALQAVRNAQIAAPQALALTGTVTL